jgi:hypothetical protein
MLCINNCIFLREGRNTETQPGAKRLGYFSVVELFRSGGLVLPLVPEAVVVLNVSVSSGCFVPLAVG